MTYAIIAAAAAGLFGLLYMLYRFVYRTGTAKGQVDQRLRDAEGAVEAQREINEIMVERRDTTDTRKRLQDASF